MIIYFYAGNRKLASMSNNILTKMAKTQRENLCVYKFRWKIYSEEKFINPNKFPSNEFKDKYDKHSINFIAYSKGEIVGVARLIKFSKIGLPVLNSHNIKIPEYIDNMNNVVEMGRFMIGKQYRKQNHEITICIAKQLYKCVLNNKFKWVLAEMPEKLKELSNCLGFNFEVLPEKLPTSIHLTERAIISGYHEKHRLFPMISNVDMMVPIF